MSFRIIIPSRTASNVAECVSAIQQREPDLRVGFGDVLVIDDGIGHYNGPGVTVLPGLKPFVFSRNCNIGIAAAGESDVILLNDDAVLETPSGFTAMARASQEHQEFGLISAVTNGAGNPAQKPQSVGLREEKRVVAFVCVYIPRATINRVGLLDERFVTYGWEDNDYCKRVHDAGLKLGIFDGCYVNHSTLPNTFVRDIAPGREIFEAKWGASA